MGAYLLSDMELLSMFGYTKESEVCGTDLEYNMYLQLGVAGLNALRNYNPEGKTWGQAHSGAQLTMFQILLDAGSGFLRINYDEVA